MALLRARGADPARYARLTQLSEQLIRAARWGRADEARDLLARGALADYVDEFETTALHEAARNRHSVEIVRMLLEAGAGAVIDRRNSHGMPVRMSVLGGSTALMLAASSGEVEIVRVLLEAGADPNIVGSSWLDGRDPHTARAAWMPGGDRGPAIVALLDAALA